MVPIKNEKGEVVLFLASHKDVTTASTSELLSHDTTHKRYLQRIPAVMEVNKPTIYYKQIFSYTADMRKIFKNELEGLRFFAVYFDLLSNPL